MVLGFLCASVASYVWQWHGWRPTVVEGVVLRADADVLKQVPISRAELTITNGRFETTAYSDAAGYFKLVMKPSWQTQSTIKLLVRHDNYTPLEIPRVTGSDLYTLHLQPKAAASSAGGVEKAVAISEVRIRYSEKTSSTVDIGSAAKTFEAPGQPDVPCGSKLPCSPDGRWRATESTQTYDAGERSQFRNIRLSCIAGPCPFTQVVSANFSQPTRIIKLTIDNWSSTATFLLEAEVTQITSSDTVREAFPVIFGSAMNFTLPAAAEGPSVEASLNGQLIVFPLGPDLVLSWADCSGQQAAANAQQYRCILKPGYQFQ